MTSLFRRLQPAAKFRISKRQVARFLRIPESLIVKIEFWFCVLFVHRRDRGGQFVSYRQLQQWQNAVACQLQKCSTWQEIKHLWSAIQNDYKKHEKQYNDSVLPFLEGIKIDILPSLKARDS
ncbi:MAG: hypothetical protein F6J89_12580 [Symploca sp. SIO1C4]|uniref:Uncharacterized protein n=1 Tax=Symploca sp. SIO1C4 TaxID=2607765 RepID=A0A6B3N9U7_9CYAN|nr:hypothetical protein [Symploca sp. SIO1C4]